MYFDSHAHLDEACFAEDFEEILARMAQNQVRGMMNIVALVDSKIFDRRNKKRLRVLNVPTDKRSISFAYCSVNQFRVLLGQVKQLILYSFYLTIK